MTDNPLAQQLLPAVLGIIMVGVGTSIQGNEFRELLRQPKAMLLGVMGQVIMLPLLAYAVARFTDLPSHLAIGFVLIGCSPGGAGSNLLSYLARADSALSVGLTVVSNLLAVLLLPMTFNLLAGSLLPAGTTIRLPVWDTILQLLAMVIVPVMVGCYLQHRYPRDVPRFEPWIRKIASLLLVVICLGMMVKESDHLVSAFLQVGLPIWLLNLLATVAGYGLASLGGCTNRQRKTIAIEVGFQNAALALTLALSVLNLPEAATPAMVYGAIMFGNALVFIWWSQKRGSMGLKTDSELANGHQPAQPTSFSAP